MSVLEVADTQSGISMVLESQSGTMTLCDPHEHRRLSNHCASSVLYRFVARAFPDTPLPVPLRTLCDAEKAAIPDGSASKPEPRSVFTMFKVLATAPTFPPGLAWPSNLAYKVAKRSWRALQLQPRNL